MGALGSSDAIRSFFRIVQTNPPAREDFLSHQARKGPPPPHIPVELRRLWHGISVYDTETDARRRAERSPYLGRYVEELRVAERGSVTYEKTTRDRRHYTLWGDPDNLLQHVVGVVLIESPSA